MLYTIETTRYTHPDEYGRMTMSEAYKTTLEEFARSSDSRSPESKKIYAPHNDEGLALYAENIIQNWGMDLILLKRNRQKLLWSYQPHYMESNYPFTGSVLVRSIGFIPGSLRVTLSKQVLNHIYLEWTV